jgi:uncharacterized membrane protein
LKLLKVNRLDPVIVGCWIMYGGVVGACVAERLFVVAYARASGGVVVLHCSSRLVNISLLGGRMVAGR